MPLLSSPKNNRMSKISQINNKLLPYIVWTLRIIIGATFIISGLTKMIDVWGFTYKIEQYLNVWGWDITRQLVVFTAITLSAIEFVVGILLATGSYRRTSTWFASVIMLIMLPLSAYIMIANPVDDCGCFGDFWKISNVSTFLKNIFISLGLIYLLKYNTTTKGIFYSNIQWLVGCFSYIYILIIGFIGYNVQPLIDFRPYKVGTSLANNSEPVQDAEYSFIYAKDGIEKEFDINNLPDSTWTFITRIDKSESTKSDIKDYNNNQFSIFSLDNEDVTNDVISTTNDQVILLIPEIKYADISHSFLINEMNKYIIGQGGELIGIFAANEVGKIDRWANISLAQWPRYIAEDSAIKELARGKMSVVYLKNGIIQWKRTLSSIPSNIFETSKDSDILATLSPNNKSMFWAITTGYLASLFVIFIINLVIIAVIRYFSRKNEKKNVTLQNKNLA